MAKFGEFKFGSGVVFGVAGSETVPGDVTATRVPWLFTDLSLDLVYEHAINPLDATLPAIKKTLNSKPLAAGGRVHYEGRPQAATMTFSGTILTEAHYLSMRAWFQENKQIQITDDIGRKYWVLLTGFSPTRTRSIGFPWRFEYQATATVLDWGNT